MNNLGRFSLLVTTIALVCGCSGAAETLGLGRNPPDEFAVVDRPLLSIPPDFSLRPPRPGAARPQEVQMSTQAEQTLFGGADGATFVSGSGANPSDSEKALLAKSGADKVEGSIREIVDREAKEKVVGSKHLMEDILWWRDEKKSAETVDAAAEAERIREAKEKGKSVTNGATPIIEKGSSGWLGL